MKTAVLFGGTGFIGSYLSLELLESNRVEKVILADLNPICKERFLPLLEKYIASNRLEYIKCDVRNDIAGQLNLESVDFVANLAAVHREPGHEAYEYYETNISGAENVCKWCSEIKCYDLLFTSSIAPYGEALELKSEKSLPVPFTPYGGSKLAAEKIHEGWSKLLCENKLTIVRPGVVFGGGEGGNVSRLIRAVLGGYFFYVGNQKTRKAGVYVKELVAAMAWVHYEVGSENRTERHLFNMSMQPAPSVKEYVDVICEVAKKKRIIPSVPFSLLLAASYVVSTVTRALNIDQPVNPVRIRKLVKSNSIDPKFLRDNGYKYRYTLLSAFSDWKKQAPKEW